MQWYKYKYIILNRSGAGVGKKDWQYMWVPDDVIKRGWDAVANYIEINGFVNNNYSHLEFKKTKNVPLDVLEKEHVKYIRKKAESHLTACRIEEMIDKIRKENAN